MIEDWKTDRLMIYADMLGRIDSTLNSNKRGYLSHDGTLERIGIIVKEAEIKLAETTVAHIEELEPKTAPESSAGFLDGFNR